MELNNKVILKGVKKRAVYDFSAWLTIPAEDALLRLYINIESII